MSTSTSKGLAWACGLLLLALGAALIGLQLQFEAVTALGLTAQAEPGLFKLVLGLEAVGVVGASAMVMVAVRDMPRRVRYDRRRRQRGFSRVGA